METTKVLMVVAVFAVLVAAVNMVAIFTQQSKVSGYFSSPTEGGNATLTVQGIASINFTNNIINWSTGAIVSGATYAYLHTNYTALNPSTYSSGGCSPPTCGTQWLNVTTGLILNNLGNTNVNLTLNASNDAAGFIGGTGPLYQWTLSYPTGNASSCLSPYSLQDSGGNYVNVAANGPVRAACQNYTWQNQPASNSIRIDLFVGVPGNAPVGIKNSTITATAVVLP